MYKGQVAVIEKTEKPYSKEDIVEGLKKLGVKKDSCLEVHTSLSSFGYLVNKAYDVCDALLEIVTEGVIIMPAHTSEQSDPKFWINPPVPKEWVKIINEKRRPFDRKIFIPERIGLTPQVFLHYPGVLRTNHPQVSLSVLNRTADPSWLEHSLDDRDFINPLYKLTQNNGKIIFMGTDFHTCTSVHLSEQFSPYAKIQNYKNKIVTDEGKVEEKAVIYYEYDDEMVDNFKEISERYIQKYQNTKHYRQVKIGLATVTMIDALKLYDLAYDFHKNYRI